MGFDARYTAIESSLIHECFEGALSYCVGQHNTAWEKGRAVVALDAFAFDLEDDTEFDPLADDVLAEDEDEGLVDMPVMAEMPAHACKPSVFSKERFASAHEAIEELFKRNPGRKPVFLDIIEFCTEPRTTTEVAEVVAKAQEHNRSVYTPMTLCSILERSGALVSEIPETADEVVEENGVEYLEVKEAPDATWTSTDAALEVLADHREGGGLRSLIRTEEPQYRTVYERLLRFCAEEPRTKPAIDALIDDDPLVQNPRRYSNHFIELLESREALVWQQGWVTTELGRRYLDELGAGQA